MQKYVNLEDTQVVSHYWLDNDTFFVCTNEFVTDKGGWNSENTNLVGWLEIHTDEGNRAVWGINAYDNDDSYIDNALKGEDCYVELPDKVVAEMKAIVKQEIGIDIE